MIVESADQAGYANAFGLLAIDRELRESMGQHNLTRVQGYSSDAVTVALADVYGPAAARVGGAQ